MIIDSIDNPDVVRALLQPGGIGVVPSDTIYGIVARVNDRTAVERLYRAKHREGKPGTIIAANPQQLIDLGLNPQHIQQVEYVWPGPASVVLPAPATLAYVHQGMESLAVRIPNNAVLCALLQKTGPLLTSSANAPGEPPATSADEARAYFGDAVDFYVQGDTGGNVPSTVAKLLPDGTLQVLRQGAAIIQGTRSLPNP